MPYSKIIRYENHITALIRQNCDPALPPISAVGVSNFERSLLPFKQSLVQKLKVFLVAFFVYFIFSSFHFRRKTAQKKDI